MPATTPRSRAQARRGAAKARTGAGPTGVASALDVPGGAVDGLVCVGAVAGAHGIAGLVKIKSFAADPASVAAYGPVSDQGGVRRFDVTIIGVQKGMVLARLSSVADRDAAEALKGVRLYVPRAALPEPEEDEFYHADLLGMAAARADGEPFGKVVAVHELGEVDALEIDRGEGLKPVLVPFTRAAVPEVDLAGRRVVVDPPPGLMDDDATPPEPKEE